MKWKEKNQLRRLEGKKVNFREKMDEIRSKKLRQIYKEPQWMLKAKIDSLIVKKSNYMLLVSKSWWKFSLPGLSVWNYTNYAYSEYFRCLT